MRVEAAVLRVADACPHIGEQDLRHALHALAVRVGAVFHIGLVLLRSRLQDVSAAQCVQSCLAQEVHHGPAANRLRVHVSEDFKCLSALVRAVNVVEQAVAFEVGYRRHRNTGRYEGARKACAEVHAADHIFAAGIHLTQRLTEPALIAHLGRLGSMPDVH